MHEEKLKANKLGGRKYCKLRFVKFPLHRFHLDTSPLLQNKHKRFILKQTTVYISSEISYYCSHVWQARATHTKAMALARSALLSSDSSLSYSALLDRFQGKLHINENQNSLPIIPHLHFTKMGKHDSWCENYHLITLKIVEVTTRPNFMFSWFVHV